MSYDRVQKVKEEKKRGVKRGGYGQTCYLSKQDILICLIEPGALVPLRQSEPVQWSDSTAPQEATVSAGRSPSPDHLSSVTIG